jgi:CspA family cold shock protein
MSDAELAVAPWERNLIVPLSGSCERGPRRLVDVANGTIKRLVRDRGFGFIRDDGGQEWFFHRSSVSGSFDQLNEGQRVSFEEEPSQKGPRAGNIRAEG